MVMHVDINYVTDPTGNTYPHLYIHIGMCTYMHTYVHIYACMHACMYFSMYAYNKSLMTCNETESC